MENPASIRPVTCRAAVGLNAARGGLLEQEVVVDELFLFLGGHPAERVIFPRHLAGHASEAFAKELLGLSALCAVDARRQWQATNGTRGADTGRDDVLINFFRLRLGQLDVIGVDVGLVRVGGLVTVPAFDHCVHEVFEHLVGIFVPRNDTNVKVRGVDPDLDDLVESETAGGDQVAVLGIKIGAVKENAGRERVVLGSEVWKIRDGVNEVATVRLGRHKIPLDVLH